MGTIELASMKTATFLTAITLFLAFGVFGFYSQYCYMQYRSLWPKNHSAGLLTGIRASLQFTHDPNDPDISDECRAYYSRFKKAAMVAALARILMMLLILFVRSFGVVQILVR
jgi:hypothetical protein